MYRNLITVFLLHLSLISFAQNEVSLVVSGDGKSKEEATSVALRSAIEQAFGTFVSANSTILNDDLVKDEIATVSSGNIESYDELSSFEINGKWEVSLKAVVSINKLVNYVKGKGAETEFAGQSFAMQMRMRALNKENEKKALTDLIRIVNDLTCNYSLYDYTLNQKESQYVDGDSYRIPIDVTASRNDNYDNLESIVLKTFQSLALSEAEIAAYTANNYPTCKSKPLGVMGGSDVYCLRSEEFFLRNVEELITRNLIFNLHCFQLARVGTGNDYLSFFKCFDGEIERISNPYMFSFSPEIPQNVLYNTVGFKVIPDLSLRNPTAECVDLGLSVRWATQNVGACPINPYGDYFAWGETAPKSNYDWSTYKWCNGSFNTQTKYNTSSSYGTVDNKTVLDPEDDAAHVNWGGSWRMPTNDEWTELRTKCTWTWTTQNGVNGRLVTGPNGKSIFLPATGSQEVADLRDAGFWGRYWSSSLNTGKPYSACGVEFHSGGVYWGYADICYGQSVRPVMPYTTSKSTNTCSQTIEEVDLETIPFQLVEVKPSFNGGSANEFSEWVNSHLKYPESAKENGVQGRVLLQFTVEANGQLANIRVYRGVDPVLDNEAVRVVQSSPKWTPGQQRGRIVAVTITFPVIFKL